MTQQELLQRRMYAIRFALWELHLYLDSHPACTQALEKQKEYTEKLNALNAEYTEKYGPLQQTQDGMSRWAWISGPWPWQNEEESV